MEVCGEEGEEGMGDVGLEATNWEMMRVYAWRLVRHVVLYRENTVYLCHGLDETSNSEHTLVDTGDDLTDTGLDTGLVSQVGDIFASLADDNASVLGANKGAKGQQVVIGG